MTYPHYVPVSSAASDPATVPPPVTPHKSWPQAAATPTPTQKSIAKLAMPSPLPPSSPLPASSSPPPSSPAPRVLHQVSSPGPMEPLPPEDQYDKLPYQLPPGPYSHTKPDLSYAALVGQAILSSIEHRLTLQEIYDWITIVYPHYKRGETTWMNSIRHVLSTTACFRKVPRDRSIGRTLWAIFDEDLECFKGGGFRKHLCKDIMLQQKEKAKKANARKRPEIEDSGNESRKSKKARKDSHYASGSMHPAPPQMSAPVPVMGPQQSYIQPYFPRPTHQPYYETCLSQPQHQVLPAEIIFPPLPPDAALRAARVLHPPIPSRPASTAEESPPLSPPHIIEKTASESSGSSSAISSMASVPELTPNRSSSTTPPSSAPATSDMDIEFIDDSTAENRKDVVKPRSNVVIAGVDNAADADKGVISSTYNEDDSVFNSSLLGPVQFWGESPRTASLLAPSIELINFDAMTDDDEDQLEVHDTKGKGKSVNRKGLYPAAPTSPTPTLSRSSGANVTELQPLSLRAAIERPKTPVKSTNALPATPPQRVRLDSTRTPISHKGLTMSPSASLAHYKSNLDPPPVIFQSGASRLLSSLALEPDSMEADNMRTPRSKASGSSSAAVAGSSSSALLGPPVTPKKGVFDSPFRTGLSPFRTPRSRDIYDPHDPRVLLDEELSRPLLGDSPVGIFGKRSSLLYDSPGVDPWSSPGKKWYW
ncbi:hypothetical protein EST38_g3712 [Candolleomyces aberdarensis]|uniref:Fork-head domain-containing protein n=1 Tax=Candolleomyces aberdarensis TaxID=2316362 RepID=A0A4Q2DQ21_9AGAR|nr:hypothetical protein EST38_g3712 [Candolleomyces aberdarensis]